MTKVEWSISIIKKSFTKMSSCTNEEREEALRILERLGWSVRMENMYHKDVQDICCEVINGDKKVL